MNTFKNWVTIVCLSGLTILLAACSGNSGHGHEASGHDHNSSAHEGEQTAAVDHAAMGHAESHKHDSWQQPPAQYSDAIWDKWEDSVIAQQGQKLYQSQCATCHGDDGVGDGLVGKALPHPPADLTNHFHPASGDGYLFWRISEGGSTVEPFKSMQSAMPAFKSSMSKDERWAVLTYIHQAFHGKFPG